MDPITVVCVDDEDVVLMSLESQLGRVLDNGCSVEVAESGEEALELLDDLEEEGNTVALVISDHIMPGMKGDELLIEVHQRLPKTLKILLTGQADAQAVGNAVNSANLYRYIAKPWDKTDLGLTVKEALRSYNQDKRLEEQNALLKKRNEELSVLNEACGQFVPHQFLSLLDKRSIIDVHRGDQVEKRMAILFSDIRDFTALSERMTPEENFAFINTYLGQMEPRIMEHGGFIDKYIGDAIMSLFPDIDSALKASLAMLDTLRVMNVDQDEPVRVGIGVHTGLLMLGVVGGSSRVDGTVIGDPVNLASRIEGLTKHYKANILLSSEAVELLKDPDAFALRKVGRASVKGRREPVLVYESFDADAPENKALKLSTASLFEQAVTRYQQGGFNDAAALFREVADANPHDRVAQGYLERLERAHATSLA